MPGIVVVLRRHRSRTQAELQDMGILWARAEMANLALGTRLLELQRRSAAKLGGIGPNPKQEAKIHRTKQIDDADVEAMRAH